MANIMHDCKVGLYATIAPNAVILGYVDIGDQCYVGANSTILPNKKIEQGAVIGAGSVVTKNIQANSIVRGNPARG